MTLTVSDGGKAMSGWRSIESAPKDGTEVLIYPDYVRAEFDYMGGNPFSKREWPVFVCDHGHTYTPSHWMPLPAPPSPRGGGE